MATRKKKLRAPPDPFDVEHFHSEDERQRELDEAVEEFNLTRAQQIELLTRAREPWTVERRVVARVLCQKQWVRCGKKCWCMRVGEPPFHGPYWYAYTFNKRGKVRCSYVGKVISAKRVLAAVE